ncbi:hypothetical protein T4D_3479 [Trichinella pseudospiralis]|uniref:Uncharacterized protein n=1 Tax=Trichinella pseudospiralis TaxID=6337 RepID=A0A0V1FHK4_TRIPS|nr:hypothetical protein T4D_3479 [Trichinella pseudospiralis]
MPSFFNPCLLDDVGLVSYTHLDVYKRQMPSLKFVNRCDLLSWLLIARCNKYLKRLLCVCFLTQSGQMSSSERVGARNVNSDGDGAGREQ